MFKALSSRAQRMFRKYLEPRPAKRPQSLSDAHRYLEDRWLTKSTTDRSMSGEYDLEYRVLVEPILNREWPHENGF